MLNIGLAVFHLLTNSADVTQYVGDNIFPLVVPNADEDGENVPFPFITFSRSGIDPEYAKDYDQSDTVNVSVDIWSRSYKESVLIATAVRKALEAKRGEWAGVRVQDSGMTSADESFDPKGYYGQTLYFEFR